MESIHIEGDFYEYTEHVRDFMECHDFINNIFSHNCLTCLHIMSSFTKYMYFYVFICQTEVVIFETDPGTV